MLIKQEINKQYTLCSSFTSTLGRLLVTKSFNIETSCSSSLSSSGPETCNCDYSGRFFREILELKKPNLTALTAYHGR